MNCTEKWTVRRTNKGVKKKLYCCWITLRSFTFEKGLYSSSAWETEIFSKMTFRLLLYYITIVFISVPEKMLLSCNKELKHCNNCYIPPGFFNSSLRVPIRLLATRLEITNNQSVANYTAALSHPFSNSTYLVGDKDQRTVKEKEKI